MRIKRILKYLSLSVLSIVVLIVGIAFGYEQISRIAAEMKYSPEGELIEVGGHRLHALALGSGAPTVVFESGMDTIGHLSWYKVQEEVSKFASTVSYDRAGVLWSERGDKPKSSESINSDLNNLLINGEFPKPYIVVGHSLAGITLRKFIDEHKNDIAGVVLVDVSHPDQALIRPPKVPPRIAMNAMSAFGLIRLTSSRVMPNTNPDDRINKLGSALVHRSIGGMFEEAASVVALSNEASNIVSFGDVPLIVLSATAYQNSVNSSDSEISVELTDRRKQMQEDLLTLSNDSRQILASESTHYIQLEQPELVVEAIKTLLVRFEPTNQ